jgi:branched-chain amino acid transport system substrate-binding protein
MNKRNLLVPFAAVAASLALIPAAAVAQTAVSIPVLVPITGFLSLEGTSQRNGALLAVRRAPAGIKVTAEVSDTGVAPDVAVNALDRVIARDKPTAVVASMLGTQMLAMLPVALEAKVPLLTVSGTAAITEQKNPFVFRFFPGDSVAKVAHVRFVVEELKKSRVALVYQTTAYGQSGRNEILAQLKARNIEPVMQEALEVTVRDMSPVLNKVRDAKPDVVILHLHSQPTALFVRAAAQGSLGLPIVAGSAMHQPPTAALLEPAELAGVCAEANASPVSADTPEMQSFLKEYRDAFNSEPDGFAVGQYDAVMMALDAVARGARTPTDVQQRLASATYKGLAMTYKSDGKGNMAHSAVIICYDGKSRVPRVAKRYDNITGVLP